jgi:hypothetical protein
MNVKSSGKTIQYAKVDGRLVRLESDYECGSGAVVWGFLTAAAALLILVIGFCM